MWKESVLLKYFVHIQTTKTINWAKVQQQQWNTSQEMKTKLSHTIFQMTIDVNRSLTSNIHKQKINQDANDRFCKTYVKICGAATFLFEGLCAQFEYKKNVLFEFIIYEQHLYKIKCTTTNKNWYTKKLRCANVARECAI